MKKYFICFIIFIIIMITLLYMYFNNIQNKNEIAKENAEYEYYYNKEIYGTDLATIINKATDINKKNNIEIDSKGVFVENNTNSIKIDIKITDNDTLYNMETFKNNGIAKFVKNFNTIKFKCLKLAYHQNTNKIKYLYFEQITN